MKAKLSQLVNNAGIAKVNIELGYDEYGEPDEFGKDCDLIVGSEPKLYSFTQDMTPEDVIEQMKKDGYYPGTMADLLTYAVNHRESFIEAGHSVMALGTVARFGSRKGQVPLLCKGYGRLYLLKTGFGGEGCGIVDKHVKGTLFIAVRK